MNKSFQVLLKRGGRTLQCHTVESRSKAEQIAQAWYGEADGNTYEIIPQGGAIEQIEPRVEPDQYLTQATYGFNRTGHP